MCTVCPRSGSGFFLGSDLNPGQPHPDSQDWWRMNWPELVARWASWVESGRIQFLPHCKQKRFILMIFFMTPLFRHYKYERKPWSWYYDLQKAFDVKIFETVNLCIVFCDLHVLSSFYTFVMSCLDFVFCLGLASV